MPASLSVVQLDEAEQAKELEELGIAPHPEAMAFAADLRISETSVLRARFRTTPASLLTTALLTAALLFGLSSIIRAWYRR